MYQFALFLQILTIIIGFIMVPIILIHKPFHGSSSFCLFLVGTMIHAYGYLIELTAKTVEVIYVAKKFQYFGFAFVNIFFIAFLSIYYNQKVNKKMLIALILYNMLIIHIVTSGNHNNIYYSSIQFIQDGPNVHAKMTYGSFYYFYLFENIILDFYVMWIILRHYFSLNISKRKLERKFVIACSIPCGISLLGLSGIFEYNTINVSISISSIFILICIYRHQLFDIIHAARDNIIDTMEDALIVIDNDYQLLDFNPIAMRLFPELAHAEHNSYIYNSCPDLYALFRNNDSEDFECNHHYYHTQITNIYHNLTVVGYTVWIFDITQSRSHMENLIQLRDAAENANKAKSVFLASMSHEIRTPLNAILGSTDILLNQKIAYQERNTLLSIKTAGTTLLKMINDILDFSRIESGKLTNNIKEYKLTTMIQDVINIISVKLSHKPIILQVEVQQDLPKFFLGDELRLRQILMNVLNNAVKYTKKGSIHLSCTSSDEITECMDQITLIFRITDTGVGISKDNQKRIFDSFERVSDVNNIPNEGSGLGLSICDKLLTHLGGSISVDSELDQGSTFTIRIPQKVSNEQHHIDEHNFIVQTIDKENVNHTYTILIVDDNAVNLQVAYGLLKIYGFKIDVASSGKQALELAEHGHYNLIFLDYMMPQMDGIQTLVAIRALDLDYCKTVPIIALTANAMPDAQEMLLSSGFNDFLSKPMEFSRLSTILNKWLSIHINPTLINGQKRSHNTRYELFKDFAEVYSIDWIYALSNCNGRWDSYFDILNLFCHDGLHQKDELMTSYHNKDYSLYCVQVHAMKSSLITIGVRDLAELALSLELASKEEDLNTLELYHTRFTHKFTMICYAIYGFLTSKVHDLPES